MPIDTPPKDAAYFAALQQLVEAADTAQLSHAAVNAPFHDPIHATSFDLGIVVLLLVNKQLGTIDRIALSDTEPAIGAVKMSEKPFSDIKIPVGHKTNIIAQAIETARPRYTGDWQYLFVPAMSAEAARFNQAGAGIECSYVYPLPGVKDGGALIFSFYQPTTNISLRHKEFMQFYSQLVGNRYTRI